MRTVSAQSYTLKGIVYDENGDPLPGVSLLIKDTNTGTITGVDGSFALQVNEGDKLVVSFVGYQRQELDVTGQTYLEVKLVLDVASLEEIVIVGYGTQRKSQSTSSIATLEGKDVAAQPVVNLSNNLAGRLPGVIATQGSGEPGFDGSAINIRGIATNGNNAPLLIVDGVYRDFSKLDPSTIESITILKDAAAVAPYGLGGANGVVLVTTKKGQSGKPTLSYNAYVGFQNPTRLTPMVNSVQWALMRNEAARNAGTALPYTDEQIAGYQRTVNSEATGTERDLYPNSNALEELIQTNAPMTYNNIELSGGTENVRYIASLGYTTQEGQWKSTSVKKYNVMMGLDADVTKSTTLSLKLNGWVQNSEYPGTGAGDLLYRAFRVPPTEANYYSNGLWGQYIGASVIGLAYHSGYDDIRENNFLSNLTIEQRIPFIPGLALKGQVSYDPYSKFQKSWRTPVLVYTLNTANDPYTYDLGYQGPAKPNLNQSWNQDRPLTYQGYITYDHNFGKHFISALGVVESRRKDYNNFNAGIINYNTTIDELDAGSSAKEDFSLGGTSSTEKQFGYVYRLGYSYNDRYLIEVSGRYDGHYSFAPGQRYSFFPAYSIGWNIGEEAFLKNALPMVSSLKLRGSYGKSGNLPNNGAFQYLSSYTLYSGAYNFGNTPGQGLSETLQGNPNITWEKSTKYDLGLEAALWNGSLTFEVDVFKEFRKDMLMGQGNSVPAEYGVTLGQANIGEMENQGIEISFGLQHNFGKDLQVGLFGNFTHVKNKMVEILETDATYNNPNRRRTGRALNTRFGYQALGYFTVDDFNLDGSLKEGIPVQPWGAVQPGDLKYADLSGPNGVPDGIINQDDETVIGKPGTPQIMFGLTPTISYKGFSLDVLFQGAAQSSMLLTGQLAHPFGGGSATELQYEDHWTPANTDATYPRLSPAPTSNNTQNSTWWIRDTRYIRLKSFQLAYTLPKGVLEKLKVVESMRFYVSGQNLFTWTPKMEEVLDPEGASNGQYYFQQRVISIGTNIQF
ncbi:SusC/RagA family TonB-linked outer membrane protein [Fulvivirga ligni]|uniref:SusC/RagA family TonB-linked outer membrane protein n=1 Tax=Fulvivirga ligni TaxID=2904246 RepID=UPI001F1988BD|nr:TonB-dependent receptor [Fulvivirga ligni]UII18953.1 TonB-dependent receptor [Fulvivirga ligni]